MSSARHVISCARHIISCARHIISCARHIISCARHNISCARHNISCVRHNYHFSSICSAFVPVYNNNNLMCLKRISIAFAKERQVTRHLICMYKAICIWVTDIRKFEHCDIISSIAFLFKLPD